MKKTMMMAVVAAMALSVNALGANLIVNGDFEAGNTGFSTDYTYIAPPLVGNPPSLGNPGVYSVDTDPKNGHSSWANIDDHTSGSGYMLIVNAATDETTNNDGQPWNPGVEIVWEQTVNVKPGKDYLLSYWLANSYSTNPAAIQVYVDGVEVGGPASFTDVGVWHPVSLTWTSGIDTTVTITLKDLTRKYNGDDFVIDDISLVDACDSATGMGTRILPKGTWFMYNSTFGITWPGIGGNVQFQIQAGNPEDGLKNIGFYVIWNRGAGNYEAEYVIDDTIEINGIEYDIVVTEEHLAVSNTMNFTGKPGRDDNQDFEVPFYDADGQFYIFAHFAVEYNDEP